MTVLLYIFTALAVLIALVLLLALFIKKNHYVKRETIINVPAQTAYNYLKLLKNQDSFNKWAKADPNRQWEYKGTDGTIGFVISWKGNKDAGEGEKEIMNLVEGRKIETQIRFVKPMETTADVIMETEALEPDKTRVSMSNSGTIKYPMNIFIPLAEKKFPKALDESLANLKAILEKGG